MWSTQTGRLAGVAIAICWMAPTTSGQPFNSGSTGVDGDLIINEPGDTVFRRTPQGGGTIFHFKSIQIATGSTLKLSGQYYTSPLFFLAQNAVTIAGAIDLNGKDGTGGPPLFPPASRAPAAPGAGGYSGGLGPLDTNPPRQGSGPGGGVAG